MKSSYKILEFVLSPDEALHIEKNIPLIVLSFNLLAQHLITGECVAYKLRNNTENPQPFRDIRLNNLWSFLSQDIISAFDILNL